MARLQVLTRVRRLDTRGRQEWRDGTNPYPGLAPFTAARSGLFFGRATEIRTLAALVRAYTGCGVLAISGSSGCGKSSLLRAGLLPVMESDDRWQVVDPWTPERDPLYAMAKALTATALRHNLDWSLQHVRERLREPAGLRELADELVIVSRSSRVLLAVDQTEELLAPAIDTEQRTALAEQLADAVTGPVRVVVTIRSEYLDDLVALPGLSADSIENELVGPLAEAMLREAIEEPARIAGLRLEPELSARLITDTETGDALPLLAFALHRLAEGRSRGGTLTIDAYHRLGDGELNGLHAVLATHADSALREAHRAGELAEEDVLTGLLRLVSTDSNGRLVRRSVEVSVLSEPMRRAVAVFVDRRLFTTDDQGVLVRFAHEALLTAWKPLAAVIAERGKALRTERSVGQAAQEWIDAGRPDGYLWDEERYTATLLDLGSSIQDSAIDVAGQVFLDATRARIEHARWRNRRRRRGTIAALTTFSAMALAAALVAVFLAVDARRQTALAVSRSLASEAQSLADRLPDTALLLSLESMRRASTRESWASLQNALSRPIRPTEVLSPTQLWLDDVTYSVDGSLLAGTGTRGVWLADGASGARSMICRHRKVLGSRPSAGTAACSQCSATARLTCGRPRPATSSVRRWRWG